MSFMGDGRTGDEAAGGAAAFSAGRSCQADLRHGAKLLLSGEEEEGLAILDKVEHCLMGTACPSHDDCAAMLTKLQGLFRL